MGAKRHRYTTIRASNSACYERGHQKIATTTVIFFGNRYACLTLLCEAFPDPGRKFVSAFDFGIMRSYFVSCKVKCAFIGKLVLHWKFEVHNVAVLSGVQQRLCKLTN